MSLAAAAARARPRRVVTKVGRARADVCVCRACEWILQKASSRVNMTINMTRLRLRGRGVRCARGPVSLESRRRLFGSERGAELVGTNEFVELVSASRARLARRTSEA